MILRAMLMPPLLKFPPCRNLRQILFDESIIFLKTSNFIKQVKIINDILTFMLKHTELSIIQRLSVKCCST